jgi:hypothetical protein
MPADHFSARWTGHIYVADSGNYTLKSFTDDGVRLWFDQQKVIDEWRPQHDEHKVDIPAEAGAHAIQMEFYEGRGEAIAQFSWTKVEPTPTPTPPPTPSPTPSASPRKPTPGPTPSPVPLPDLAISRLRWEPATLHEGDAITRWCVTVENLGGDYTPAATYIDIAVDGRDMLGVTEWQIGRLKAGGSREICKSGDPSELGTGSHTAVATIDRGDHVDEIDEENNTFTKGLVVGPPR